ncbi:sensor histidine kinase [Aquibacillus sediminis]|uniref:sensor histidine kinase n=1 Tax=Aquibacillus sediminis TaxID=2574734 RepID=UPI0011097ECE|nr:HAMP domain-containing sensor histidine kinase [Aquibacillus sediminis]
MKNKISFKLGLLFLIFILLMESMLFFFLYVSITNERVESETENLLSRGMNHRDVLEKNFEPTTIEHVALMESEADTKVVIVDDQFNQLDASHDVNQEMKHLIQKGETMEFSHHGILVESRWRTEPYLATISPININGETKGYVYMFAETVPIRQMIRDITISFLIVGIVAVVVSIVTIFYLSRSITRPLIKMKTATEKLKLGNHDVILDTFRDDELGELARTIQSLSEELEHLKKERSEFLASISHELRTPLTYLKGYADLLSRTNLHSEDREKFAAIIQEEATKLTEMVKDLFMLAKMDQNQFLIQKEKVRLYEFLQDMIEKFSPAFKEKNIQLEFSCNKNIEISIDPIRFRQVISNLLDNAWKYAMEQTKVSVTVVDQTETVRIEISDQGEGISESELPYIWERLYRVEKSRSRETGGSGLGLAIVKEIVERHGGIVEVNSVMGKGSTFAIMLKKSENTSMDTM